MKLTVQFWYEVLLRSRSARKGILRQTSDHIDVEVVEFGEVEAEELFPLAARLGTDTRDYRPRELRRSVSEHLADEFLAEPQPVDFDLGHDLARLIGRGWFTSDPPERVDRLGIVAKDWTDIGDLAPDAEELASTISDNRASCLQTVLRQAAQTVLIAGRPFIATKEPALIVLPGAMDRSSLVLERAPVYSAWGFGYPLSRFETAQSRALALANEAGKTYCKSRAPKILRPELLTDGPTFLLRCAHAGIDAKGYWPPERLAAGRLAVESGDAQAAFEALSEPLPHHPIESAEAMRAWGELLLNPPVPEEDMEAILGIAP